MMSFPSDQAPVADPVPAAFHIVAATGRLPVLLVCDHASAWIPSGLDELGLAGEDRFSHVAWDLGAADVTRALARRLGCAAILAGVSRLVIDCNRTPGAPDSIPACSCGITVKGNHPLGPAEADRRADRWFRPYHAAIDRWIDHLWREVGPPAVVGVHSFTPRLPGQAPRPWHVGVVWNKDSRLAAPVLAGLRRQDGVVVGDNQPYSGHEINYTLDTHAGSAGLPSLSVEIRQDLLETPAARERWAALLAEILAPVLARSALSDVRQT